MQALCGRAALFVVRFREYRDRLFDLGIALALGGQRSRRTQVLSGERVGNLGGRPDACAQRDKLRGRLFVPDARELLMNTAGRD